MFDKVATSYAQFSISGLYSTPPPRRQEKILKFRKIFWTRMKYPAEISKNTDKTKTKPLISSCSFLRNGLDAYWTRDTPYGV